MVTRSSLQSCIEELEELTQMKIEDIVYNREYLPVLSEFQIIGNWILKGTFDGSLETYVPLPWPTLFASHGEKIPVIKYNLKDHPYQLYDDLLSGVHAKQRSRAKLLASMGEGWC